MLKVDGMGFKMLFLVFLDFSWWRDSSTFSSRSSFLSFFEPKFVEPKMWKILLLGRGVFGHFVGFPKEEFQDIPHLGCSFCDGFPKGQIRTFVWNILEADWLDCNVQPSHVVSWYSVPYASQSSLCQNLLSCQEVPGPALLWRRTCSRSIWWIRWSSTSPCIAIWGWRQTTLQ